MVSIKDLINWKTFSRKYARNCARGAIKDFDDEFYAQFEGKYFHGLPIYFYISPAYAAGRCYSASAILGIAMGDCYVCRGDLTSQSLAWGRDMLGHGWVEKDGYVYDTSWGIYCKAEVYNRVFKPENCVREESGVMIQNFRQALAMDGEDPDLEIHDKEWYEENYSSATLHVWEARVYAQRQLEFPNLSAYERGFWEKFLNDLPEEGKIKGPKLYFYEKGEE